MSAFTRTCDHCGKQYTALRVTSKFCSASCRSAARRDPKPEPEPQPEPVAQEEPPSPTPADVATHVQARVLAALTESGRVDTLDGQLALALAGQIDRGADSGSAMVSLARGVREAMAAALADLVVPMDPAQKAEAARAARRASA